MTQLSFSDTTDFRTESIITAYKYVFIVAASQAMNHFAITNAIRKYYMNVSNTLLNGTIGSGHQTRGCTPYLIPLPSHLNE